MARKKKHPEHVNHERWLISYADFITLLFAFFVVMFAVSQVDSKKVGRFTESFSKAIGVDMFPQPGHGLLSGATDGTVSEEEGKGSMLPEELQNLKASINQSTQAQTALAGVQIISKRNEIVLRLSDNLMFESGNDRLEERARTVVSALASELRKRNVDIRVEGHTDDRPIKTARFRSNWDLSTARATTIVVRLAAEGIAPSRLSAAGYGEFHPIAPNTSDEGRKQNRRVDLVIGLPAVPEAPPDSEEAAANTTTADGGLAKRPSVSDGGGADASSSASTLRQQHDDSSTLDGGGERHPDDAIDPKMGNDVGAADAAALSTDASVTPSHHGSPKHGHH